MAKKNQVEADIKAFFSSQLPSALSYKIKELWADDGDSSSEYWRIDFKIIPNRDFYAETGIFKGLFFKKGITKDGFELIVLYQKALGEDRVRLVRTKCLWTTTKNIKITNKIIQSWGNQKDYFLKSDFIIIKDWYRVKRMLFEKIIVDGKQYHTGWLLLFDEYKQGYLVRQPQIDDIFKFEKRHNIDTGVATE